MVTYVPDYWGTVKIPGHPGDPSKGNLYEGECYWFPKGGGWVVSGSGVTNPKPCQWIGHPWGDKDTVVDTEAEVW